MVVRDLSAFQVPDYLRRRWVEEATFFYDQANKRLLSQFADSVLKTDADEHAQLIYAKMGQRFDPELHDPGSDAEDAYHEGVELYRLLSEMKDDVRLSMIATMFHNWEKELREWLMHEVRHWHPGDAVKDAIWSVTLDEIYNLLKVTGYFDVRGQIFYSSLDSLRLVVNVFKHGDGQSLKQLDSKFPRFTARSHQGFYSSNLRMRILRHEHMVVTDADFLEFSQALILFWEGLPDNIMVSELKSLPKWFRDARK
ncbi:hypothetical protein [Litoreibacter arenae]|uniref:hypothetical protein n=1 Tax=Litoreibacter arenae TaxID=491388 RepID=UPI000688080C|nr:hypothetical protein [Litoreibacter arenae]